MKYPAIAVDAASTSDVEGTDTTTSCALVQTSPPEANIVGQAADGDPNMDIIATQFDDEEATTSCVTAEALPPEANIDTQFADEHPLVDDATKVGEELAETDDCSESESMDTCSTCFEDEAHTCDGEMLGSDKDNNVVATEHEPAEPAAKIAKFDHSDNTSYWSKMMKKL